MTKDINQENTLKVIRYIQDNVEGLKELSFGCEIQTNEKQGKLICITHLGNFDAASCYELKMYNSEKKQFAELVHKLKEVEIIGHEPQLNHLLLAMNKAYKDATKNTFYAGGDFSHCYCVCSDNTLIEKSSSLGKNPVIKTITVYDLTKTVQENLESNPELCQYLLDLFQLTTNN